MWPQVLGGLNPTGLHALRGALLPLLFWRSEWLYSFRDQGVGPNLRPCYHSAFLPWYHEPPLCRTDWEADSFWTGPIFLL